MWADEPETPEELLMRKEAVEISLERMRAMPERFADALDRVANGETYQEIGAHHDLSRERIRQIVERGARQLRHAHDVRGSWVTTRGPCCDLPAAQERAEALPNALCCRCGIPFMATYPGGRRRLCHACMEARAERVAQMLGGKRSTCPCCGVTRDVKTKAGVRCRPCHLRMLADGRRNRSAA